MATISTHASEEFSSNLYFLPVLVSENVSPESFKTIARNIEKLYLDAIASAILKRVSGSKMKSVMNFESQDLLKEAFGSDYNKAISDLEPTSTTITFSVPSGGKTSLLDALSSSLVAYGMSINYDTKGGKVSGGSTGKDPQITLTLSTKVVPSSIDQNEVKNLFLKDFVKVADPKAAQKKQTVLDRALLKYKEFMSRYREKSFEIKMISKLAGIDQNLSIYSAMASGKLACIILDVKDSLGFPGENAFETLSEFARALQKERGWADIIINNDQSRNAIYCTRMYESKCSIISHDKSIVPQDRIQDRFVVVS